MKSEKHKCSYCRKVHDYEHETVCDNSLKSLAYKYTISDDAFPSFKNGGDDNAIKILNELMVANSVISDLKKENEILTLSLRTMTNKLHNQDAKHKRTSEDNLLYYRLLCSIKNKYKPSSKIYKEIDKIA